MQVSLRGDDTGVPEAFLDHLKVRTTGEEPGRVRVAQVVHPQPGEPGRVTDRVPRLGSLTRGVDLLARLRRASVGTVATSGSPGLQRSSRATPP